MWGKTDTDPVNLANVASGQGGFVIEGRAGSGPTPVAAAGDVNGDGRPDLVHGTYQGA